MGRGRNSPQGPGAPVPAHAPGWQVHSHFLHPKAGEKTVKAEEPCNHDIPPEVRVILNEAHCYV